jgi:hypothetical protein
MSLAGRAASALLSGLLTLPLAAAVNDAILGVLPPPLHNAGLVAGLQDDEAVLVRRRATVRDGDLVVFRWPYAGGSSAGAAAAAAPAETSRAPERGVGRVRGEPGDLVLTLADGWGGQRVGGFGGGHDGFGGGHLTRVQAGQVYLLTDEEEYAAHAARGGSDGRDFGPQSAALVEGKAVAVVWPPWKARLLR